MFSFIYFAVLYVFISFSVFFPDHVSKFFVSFLCQYVYFIYFYIYEYVNK